MGTQFCPPMEKKEQTMQENVVHIPNELICIIIHYASNCFSNLFHLSLTCKYIHEYINESCCMTWKQAFIVRFPKEYHQIIKKTWWKKYGMKEDSIVFDIWNEKSSFKRLCNYLCNDIAKEKIRAAYEKQMSLIRAQYTKLAPDEREMNRIQIIVLGDGGVGKSATAIQLESGYFASEYDPTIEDTFTIYVMHHDIQQPYAIDLLDTAGQSSYSAMRDVFIRKADAYIVMYSLDSLYSLRDTCYLDQIQRVRDEIAHVPIMVVGNKSDISVDDRAVTDSDLQEIASKWNNPYIRFMEISALTRDNLDHMIQELISLTIEHGKHYPNNETTTRRKKKKKCIIH